jgi:DNA-binding beta-propeller fold protein YncE
VKPAVRNRTLDGARRLSGRRVKTRVVLVSLLATVLSSGCATGEKPKLLELAWPEPPEPARVKFVRTMASESDLGKQASVMEDVVGFLAGKKPPIDHLAQPVAIAVSDDGNRIYVSDYGQRRVYVFDLTGQRVTRLGDDQRVGTPFGVALDADENLYVADQEAKVVRVFDRAGRPLRMFGEQKLSRPTGLAVDRKTSRVFVADSTVKQRSLVKVFDVRGEYLGSIGEGREGDGYAYFPTYLAVGDRGELYVTDTLNSRVLVFDTDGQYVRQVGERGTAWGNFDKPKGVALDTFGNLYVVDSGWSNVQIFNQRGQTLLFFGGRSRYPGLLENPTGVAIDARNRIYVADTLNLRVNVYQLVNTTADDSDAPAAAAPEKGGASQGSAAALTSVTPVTQQQRQNGGTEQ